MGTKPATASSERSDHMSTKAVVMTQQSESCEIGLTRGRPALRGSIDYQTCRYVDSWLSHAAPREVDGSEVTFLDAFGLRVLVDARIRDAKFRIVNPSDAIRGVLESAGMLEYLSVFTPTR